MLYGVSTRASVLAAFFVLFYFSLDIEGQAVTSYRDVSEHQLSGVEKKTIKPDQTAEAPPDANLTPESTIFTSNNAVELNNLGVKYVSAELFSEAVLAFQRALQIDPGQATIYHNLSVAYDRMERFDDALDAVKKAVTLGPGNRSSVFHLCQMQLYTKHYRETIGCFETLRGLTPLDEYSLYANGIALMNIDDLGKAYKAFEEAATLAPNYVPAICGIGTVHYLKKRYKESAAAFRRALELEPDNQTLRYNLAVAELGNKNKTAAVSEYSFLKQSNPELAQKLYKFLFADKVVFVKK